MESRLMYSKLKKDTLQLDVYVDALFDSYDDLSSQLAFILLLYDGSNASHVFQFSSKKSYCVVRFITAGEAYAFIEAFDPALIAPSNLVKNSRDHHFYAYAN